MIKALIIVTSKFGLDGISNVVTNYYIYQDHSKIKMDIITINDIPTTFEKQIKKNNDEHFIMGYRNTNPIKYILKLAKLCKKKKYDLVHIHGNSNTMFVELLASLIGGIPTRISHIHNTKCNHPIINTLLYPFSYLITTDRFACGYDAGKWLYGKSPFIVINNGVDLKRFTPNSQIRKKLRDELNLNEKLVIGHVGRFSIQKNHKKLITIFSSLHDCTKNVALLMWGEGELIENTRKLSKAINADIRFMGTSYELEKWLNVVDIIVFPSIFEGLPLFLIEAQAMGIRCIVSNTVSPKTKITDQLTFHTLNDTDASWAKDILNASKSINYNSTNTHESIIKANYDIRTNCKTLIDIYSKLILKNHG